MVLDKNIRGSITLSKDDWGNDLWKQVGETLRILTHSGYQCIVRNDEPAFDIVVIDFTYDSHLEWGNYVVVLDAEQYEELMFKLENDIEE